MIEISSSCRKNFSIKQTSSFDRGFDSVVIESKRDENIYVAVGFQEVWNCLFAIPDLPIFINHFPTSLRIP